MITIVGLWWCLDCQRITLHCEFSFRLAGRHTEWWHAFLCGEKWVNDNEKVTLEFYS